MASRGAETEHDVQERYFLVCSNVKIPYWQVAAAGLNRAASQLKLKAELVGPDSYDAKAQQQEFQRIVRLNPMGSWFHRRMPN